eukprot:TRINITY_DN26491_c0_g1_i2.p1 TRINITY_DN26491_c0_g1~~TRINITY_DN26491_c0_g1_i2.p1  ORF type:complete len:312 (-),score=29.20 TRINITY_DN26491_c0_g1_i2:51-986(-)
MRIKKYDDGLPDHTVRELECAKRVSPEFAVPLLSYFPLDGSIVLVYEYMPSDLNCLLGALVKPLLEGQVKTLMLMLLRGLRHCHAQGLMHRDIKPGNLLIKDRVLRLGDFGLGKPVSPKSFHTLDVGTRWYKAPEILFGDKEYGFPVDIWAAGCIMGELIEGVPLFPGINDLEQLSRIMRVFGPPTEESWPKFNSLPDYGKMCFPEPTTLPSGLEALVARASPLALDLLKKMLTYDPEARITAADALKHSYFTQAPLPFELSQMPFIPRDPQLSPVSYTHLTLPTILLVQISVVAVSFKKKKQQKHQVTRE